MDDFKVLPLTPRQLYLYAQQFGLADERIRICDGAAVSFFPTTDQICRSKNKIIIDVSDIEPIEYDELADDDRSIVYRINGVEFYSPSTPINDDL